MTTATTPLVSPISERDHTRGPEDAPVTLLEYGDYECPYCAAAHPIVETIRRRMGDHLLFAFRNFPLTEVHPHAETAARMAEAADMHGNYWPAHDALFARHELVTAGEFGAIIAPIGLDYGTLANDMLVPAITRRLREDFRSGVRSGVNGTPTFFIDGYRYDGSWDDGALKRTLQARGRVKSGRA